MSDDFVKIARCGDLAPGKMVRTQVNGRRLLIANVDGRYYVADDTCTHEDASLSTGALCGEIVKCPLHGSRFDLRTGEVLDDPAVDNLRIYPVRLDGDHVFVKLD